MSNEPTDRMPNDLSFQQRVLSSLDAIGGRLKTLEERTEQRAVETRPIWERALAEILEIKERLGVVEERLGVVEERLGVVEERLGSLEQGLRNVERKLDVLSRDIIQVRADQTDLERRLDKLEPGPAQ